MKFVWDVLRWTVFLIGDVLIILVLLAWGRNPELTEMQVFQLYWKQLIVGAGFLIIGIGIAIHPALTGSRKQS